MIVAIRNADIQDAEVLASAEKAAATIPGLLVSKPDELKIDNFINRIVEASRGNGKYIVATGTDKRVIGHASLSPMALANHSHILRLDIFVHAPYRNQGIGKAMLQHLLEWCSGIEHILKVELLVRESNLPAIALYEGFGFIVEGRLNRRVRVSETEFVADLSMAKLL